MPKIDFHNKDFVSTFYVGINDECKERPNTLYYVKVLASYTKYSAYFFNDSLKYGL